LLVCSFCSMPYLSVLSSEMFGAFSSIVICYLSYVYMFF
jgi:hypothetical protein